jgi:hypothetical protein
VYPIREPEPGGAMARQKKLYSLLDVKRETGISYLPSSSMRGSSGGSLLALLARVSSLGQLSARALRNQGDRSSCPEQSAGHAFNPASGRGQHQREAQPPSGGQAPVPCGICGEVPGVAEPLSPPPSVK